MYKSYPNKPINLLIDKKLRIFNNIPLMIDSFINLEVSTLL